MVNGNYTLNVLWLLSSYIEQHNMLSEHQYGFRSGLSTSLAIYDMHENFLQNTEKELTTCAVFCDLSKAFDTLDHQMLLWKLEHFYGIRGLSHKLLTSYLQDRHQYTVVGGYRSTTQGVSLGVPQGSSLGPLLFALYVNDLPQASNLTPTLFADDTLLTIACANSANLQNGVNHWATNFWSCFFIFIFWCFLMFFWCAEYENDVSFFVVSAVFL